MKKKLLFPSMLLVLSALSLNSCGEDVAGGSDATGSIMPKVEVDTGFLGVDVISKAGNGSDRTIDDLALTITSADGSYSRTWESVSDFDPNEQFPIGTYTVEVSYGDPKLEGIESDNCEAAYYDSQTIKVLEGVATPVSLNAQRTHAQVEIRYTEAFDHYVKSGDVTVLSSTNKGIHFAYGDYPDEGTALIVPGLTKILLDFQKYNDVWARNLQAASFETKARGHYTVTLNVNNGELGQPVLQVTFDDNTTEEVVEIDISDDVVTAPAPELVVDGVANGGELTVVEGIYSGDPVKVTIISKGGLGADAASTTPAEVNLKVKSTYLLGKTWEAASESAGVNLLTLSESQQGKYTQAGLVCHGIWNQPGRMAEIDFTNVIKQIPYLEYDEKNLGNVSSFTLSVSDCYGKVCEVPVSFSVKVQPISIALQNPSYLNVYDTELDVELAFNGGDPTGLLKVSVKNERNTFDQVPATVVEQSTPGVYKIHVAGLPADANDVVMRAEVNGKRAEDLKIERHGVIASSTANNVFAKYAYVTLTPVNLVQADVENPAFQLVSDNNKALTASKYADNVYKVEGLIPGTEQKITAKFNKSEIYCVPVVFTTESDAQLENGAFDADFTINGSASNWENVVVPGGWGTNNAMTTSQGSNYAYCRISGTIQTTDGHSGKAALIRTIGWGSGNTATGSGGSSGNTKYTDAGLLHLGAIRTTRPNGYSDREGALTTDDLDCGVGFNSRPSTLSFWYKYSPKNSADQGEAEVWVKDANGNILASGKILLSAASNYTKINVPLTYSYNAAKATKLYVKFLSTKDRKFLEKSDANFSGPGFANVSRGTFMGSQLYIDDIELIY